MSVGWHEELLGFGRRTPVVLQTEAAECGLACLAMVASHHGLEIGIAELRRRFPISLKGATLRSLIHIAEDLGLETRATRVDLPDLSRLALPAILHWNFGHFVVLTGVVRRRGRIAYEIHDPGCGRELLDKEVVSRSFTGVALQLAPGTNFAPARMVDKLRLRHLWSRSEGLAGSIAQILLLSLLLNALMLSAPLFLQLAIDRVLPTGDRPLMTILALAFGAVALLSTITFLVRGRAMVELGHVVGYHLTANIFRHMLRLPLTWFEKRHVGDVIARYSSTQPISELLTRGLIEGVVDALFAMLALAMIFLVSPLIGLVSALFAIAQTALSLVLTAAINSANRTAIKAQAKELSTSVETLYGMGAIKAFGVEGDRLRLWRARKSQHVHAAIRVDRLRNAVDGADQGVASAEQIVFVVIAVGLAMEGALTLGALVALVAYRAMFMRSAQRVLKTIRDYRELDLHLERLSDIVQADPEPRDADAGLALEDDGAGAIRLRGVSFRYGVSDPLVLSGIDLSIGAGESVAIVGPSGCGKTTLARIMAGLSEPVAGSVEMNGRSLAGMSPRHWRRAIGYVAQDDVLFAGSIAENITFYDPASDNERMYEVARLAAIHDEIMAMPMRYETLVGDMGSALSGGQKARVLLARALYRSPSILIMDEGTAHLDVDTEARVSSAIASLGITRISIAHRPETIIRADRILEIKDGQIAELSKRRPQHPIAVAPAR